MTYSTPPQNAGSTYINDYDISNASGGDANTGGYQSGAYNNLGIITAAPPVMPSLPPSGYNYNSGYDASGTVLTSSNVGGSGRMAPKPDPNNPPLWWCMYHETDGHVDGFDCFGPSVKNPVNRMPVGWRNCYSTVAGNPSIVNYLNPGACDCQNSCEDSKGNPITITTGGVKKGPGFSGPPGDYKPPTGKGPESGPKPPGKPGAPPSANRPPNGVDPEWWFDPETGKALPVYTPSGNKPIGRW